MCRSFCDIPTAKCTNILANVCGFYSVNAQSLFKSSLERSIGTEGRTSHALRDFVDLAAVVGPWNPTSGTEPVKLHGRTAEGGPWRAGWH